MERWKVIITHSAFLIIFSAIFIFNSAVQAAEDRLPVISVNGEGIVETSPDRATISVGVVSREKDPTKVQAENAKIASEIIKSVSAFGIEKKNIRTGNYSFRQIYHNDQNHRRIFDGYEVNNTVSITVDDLNLVGKIIDSALSHGANSIESLQFGIRDKSALTAEALKLAVRDARNKAEVVAAGLGKNIVGIRSVSINSGSISAPRFAKLAMVADEAANSFETPIEGGSLSCSASVHVEFEINR